MICLNCKEKLTSLYAKKFCSHSCSATYHNSRDPKRRRRIRYCKHCSQPIAFVQSMTRKAYCKRIICDSCYNDKTYLRYNSRRIVNEQLTVADLKKRSSNNQRPWTDAVRSMARSWFPAKGKTCGCGYTKHVEVCHKKAITEFLDNAIISQINASNNIMFLCPNCHWEHDNL